MKKVSKFTGRRASRFFTVQALYQAEHSDQPLSFLIDGFIKEHLHDIDHNTAIKSDEVFFADLMEGTWHHRDEIDNAIRKILAEGWAIERLDEVVHAILRLGAYECLYTPETPISVIVNEYLEVAKAFFSQGEVTFIHVALDNLGKMRTPPL